MTDQATIDFARILQDFPESTLDDTGHPVIRITVNDRASDPVTVVFEDGCIVFPGAPVALRVSTVEHLAKRSYWALRLVMDWAKSPSGQAWEYKQLAGLTRR